MAEDLKDAALYYHETPVPGKMAVVPTKPMATQRDLSLAYSPGVAYACTAIAEDPSTAARYTGRQNLVGVVTNGTAVLGLGNIGPLASKPVMEGKAALFKKFADIDVFDIEVAELDVDRFVEVVAALEPTFGGINLEDIKAPECFEIERKLRQRMNIPVFHDDQHGTAICVGAAIFNALRLVEKPMETVRLVTSGAGAAAMACIDLLVAMGLKTENVIITDIDGVVYTGRSQMNPVIARYATDTPMRTLAEAVDGADIFLGLSAPGVLKPEMVKTMADRPIIMALANPTPEIMPEEAKAVRDDAIIATGRSDYPNQVNNVLCFPFIFRGALDVGATTINEEMKIAAVTAIADLAMQEASDIVATAYSGQELSFGPEYLIPKPFDPRLIMEIAPRVAQAAMDSGVAVRPIEDFDAYRQKLSQFVYRSGQVMRPIFSKAREEPKRVVFAEGEEERVLRAVQSVLDEKLAKPILIGRPDVIERRLDRFGLRLKVGRDVEVVDPSNDERYELYWRTYHGLMERRGVSPDRAREVVRTNDTVIAALMMQLGDADAAICGTVGRYWDHLRHIRQVIGTRRGVNELSAVSLLILPQGSYFMVDTHVTTDPSADALVEMVELAAIEVRAFGLEPKVAFVSHSHFGSSDEPSAQKMRQAVAKLAAKHPGLEVEGEMHADSAISEVVRNRTFPNSRLQGAANLLVMPTLDSANVAFNLMKSTGQGLSVGPMLVGTAKPMHILTQSVTVRGIINMTAVAVVDAQAHEVARRKPVR
ncbi:MULTISPECIES: NADP-dependent malic enzyme [Thalassobaculum]|uniref:Malate dehydrogenase (Oxaloacetate-decarboxylating)(NADP+) n=1 Tax=Thalassobaculum litoreum DSM 18839 TaxID=1123362 RepID=A0A8G2EXQ5_9PROT|nr:MULTISPECIES: NADP-dependent malic enzyme [Thalassobaculum]SDG28883.1 malate dehydrogenase (oxaloacetate-decarboxylating)(NADP+) [Thalassobaculum litoreum DSM 18839]